MLTLTHCFVCQENETSTRAPNWFPRCSKFSQSRNLQVFTIQKIWKKDCDSIVQLPNISNKKLHNYENVKVWEFDTLTIL